MKVVTKTWLLAVFVLFGTLGGTRIEADGISGSGYVRHGISGFEGLVLGGVRYDTSQAVVRINGEPADGRDLKVGQLVLVRGDVDAAEAQYVDYYDTLRGEVERVQVRDAGLRQLVVTVMNQEVVTNNETWFHGGEFEDIVTGVDIAVSGHRKGDGTIMATALTIGASGEAIVTGRVTQVIIHGVIFRVGNVLVSAAMAATPGEPIGLGTEVFVRGEYRQGILAATRVETIDLNPLTDSPFLVEGVLEAVGGGWQIDGRPLQLSEDLRIDKGDASQLASGALVNVQGTLGSDGVVRAVAIKVESTETFRVDGRVSWFDADKGTLTVDGVELLIGDDVRMKDERDGERSFSLQSLVTDDAVSVTVQERGGRLHLRSLARKSRVQRMQRARVQNVNDAGDIQVLGRNVRELLNAETIHIDGEVASSHQLRRALRRGHDLRMTWNEVGDIETVEVFTEAGQREKQSRWSGR